MGKRRRILLAALLVVVLGGLAWVVVPFGPREPVYEGKPVSYWLKQERMIRTKPGVFEITHFPTMDSRAVPFLVSELEASKPVLVLRSAYESIWNTMPTRLQNCLPAPANNEVLRMNAIEALGALGNDAKPAIPALIRLWKRDHDPTDGQVLKQIDPDAAVRAGVK